MTEKKTTGFDYMKVIGAISQTEFKERVNTKPNKSELSRYCDMRK